MEWVVWLKVIVFGYSIIVTAWLASEIFFRWYYRELPCAEEFFKSMFPQDDYPRIHSFLFMTVGEFRDGGWRNIIQLEDNSRE